MQIKLQKYKGNTVYSIYTEKYGREYHLGYVQANEIDEILPKDLEEKYNNIEKPCPEAERMSAAIGNMIELERKSGLRFTDSRGNHRDGLD
tara:strand:+ start:232 stop:504 length:273 start_codon:yes stop_codon:yes gene_type:complete